MRIAKLRERIEACREPYLDLLFEQLRQPSISAQGIGMRECAEGTARMMEYCGLATRMIETDGFPVVYGERIVHPEAFTLLMFGHYDVQPPEPLEAWLSSPFEPTIRNGRIYARGAGDNKGQHMAKLLGIRTYVDVFGELPINIKFVLEGEEEVSSPNLAAFVTANRELLKADLVYTSDAPMPAGDRPCLRLGARGLLYAELTAHGADRDNHSGNTGGVVPNAAWTLVQLLGTMRDRDGRVLIEGFYEGVEEPTEAELRHLAAMPYDKVTIGRDIGYAALELDGVEYYRRLMFEPTLNICGIQSGYTGPGSKTVTPAAAMAKLDMRLVGGQDPERLAEQLKTHVRRHAPGVEVYVLGSSWPSRTSSELEVVRVVAEAVQASYGIEPIIEPSLGGTLPDYVWTRLLGLPSVMVPYANSDEANHAPNENIKVDCFLDGIRCTAAVIDGLGRRVG